MMDNDKNRNRSVEALQGIYRSKGVDLSEDEAEGLAHHLGNKPVRAAILGAVIILALVAFLVIRFVL